MDNDASFDKKKKNFIVFVENSHLFKIFYYWVKPNDTAESNSNFRWTEHQGCSRGWDLRDQDRDRDMGGQDRDSKSGLQARLGLETL